MSPIAQDDARAHRTGCLRVLQHPCAPCHDHWHIWEAQSPNSGRMAAQDIAPVSEGIVFQPDMPVSPFQRDIGTHQMRQRLSLDATSLVRQGGSLESMTFERKQQVNRR